MQLWGKMKYFRDEKSYLVDGLKNSSEHLDYAEIHRRNVTKKIVKAYIIVFVVGAFVAGGGFFYARHKSSTGGVGGLETAGAPNLLITPQVADGFDISSDIIEETSAFTDIDGAAANESPEMLTYFTYRVKKGDMIGLIAEKYGITQDTIISINNIRQSRLIQIDQFLKIPSMPGILYTAKVDDETLSSIAEKYEVSLEKCASLNGLGVEDSLSAGKTIFVPDASLDWATLQEINGDLFIKPLRSYRLSSYYGWRSSPFSGSRSFHSGVDMAAPQGTSVYAALNGRVTSTGFNSTYGNFVIISHHSGYQTLYGHMSAILVSKGQWVDTNTRIGRVGSTGLSTGPHLHFTVTKNGSTVNPIALWK